MTLLIRKLSSHIKAAILSIHRMFSGSSPSQPIPASVVIPVQAHQIDPARVSRHAAQVTETLTRAGYRAFIVGGAARASDRAAFSNRSCTVWAGNHRSDDFPRQFGRAGAHVSGGQTRLEKRARFSASSACRSEEHTSEL